MIVARRSFVLAAAFGMMCLFQFLVARGYGHQIAFETAPTYVPPPLFYEHPVLPVPFLAISLGIVLGLLVLDRPQDQSPRMVHRMAYGFSGMFCLIGLFAFMMLPDPTVWVVLGIDVVIAFAVVARIVVWVSEGATITIPANDR